LRSADIFVHGKFAGLLVEDEKGYTFVYDKPYTQLPGAEAVSLTLPLREEAYNSKVMFSFFDGLIPEGWLLDVAQENWKLDARDRMGLLLVCCRDCIGAVSVRESAELQ
jgi:serine/threonine-protein kinase HipA